jgi:hypothetical protein
MHRVTGTVVATSFDLDAARAGMRRDLHELASGGLGSWIVLGAVTALPVVAGALFMATRRRVFLLSAGCPLLVVAGWLLYYARHWYDQPLAEGRDPQPIVIGFALPLLLLGWSVLVAAYFRPTRLLKSYLRLLDPRTLR